MVKGLSDTNEGGGRVEDLQIIELYFSRDEQAITETDRFPISAGQFFLLLFSYNTENSKNNQANKPEAQQIYQ